MPPRNSNVARMDRRAELGAVGPRIAEAIRVAGESIHSVAQATGIPTTDLKQYLTSEAPFPLGALGKVGGFLSLPPQELIGARS